MTVRHTIRPVQIDPSDSRISHEDYLSISPWWRGHGADAAPPRLILPTLGGIAEDSSGPVAVSFLYLDATGSGAAWLSWTATRPGCTPRMAKAALSSLISYLSEVAKDLNYWVIGATFAPRGLIRLLQSIGFSTGDTGLVHLYKPL